MFSVYVFVCVCVFVYVCGVGGVAAVSNTVHCWQRISSEVICYSDRAASIFSQRERTNNEAGKTKVDNKGTRRERERKREREKEEGREGKGERRER